MLAVGRIFTLANSLNPDAVLASSSILTFDFADVAIDPDGNMYGTDGTNIYRLGRDSDGNVNSITNLGIFVDQQILASGICFTKKIIVVFFFLCLSLV